MAGPHAASRETAEMAAVVCHGSRRPGHPEGLKMTMLQEAAYNAQLAAGLPISRLA